MSVALRWLSSQRRIELKRRLADLADESLPLQRSAGQRPGEAGRRRKEKAESLRRQIDDLDVMLAEAPKRSASPRTMVAASHLRREPRMRDALVGTRHSPRKLATASSPLRRDDIGPLPPPMDTPDPGGMGYRNLLDVLYPKWHNLLPLGIHEPDGLDYKSLLTVLVPDWLSYYLKICSQPPATIFVAPEETIATCKEPGCMTLPKLNELMKTHPLTPGTRVIFKAGVYSNIVNGKATAFNFHVWEGICASKAPITIEAEAGAEVNIHMCAPPIPAGLTDEQVAKAAWSSVFYIGTHGGVKPTDIPVILRNLNFIGRGIKPGTEWQRATDLLTILTVRNLTVQGCKVIGTRDIGADPALMNPYGAAAGNSARIEDVTSGLIEDCTFEPMTDIDEALKKTKVKAPTKTKGSWRWKPDTHPVEGLLLGKCKNLVVRGCAFGSAGHFCLQMRTCQKVTVEECYFRNRIHSGVNLLDLSSDCVFRGNLFAGVGAMTDLVAKGISGAHVFFIDGGKNHILAFNIIHADEDSVNMTGYKLDEGIVLSSGGSKTRTCGPSHTARCTSKACHAELAGPGLSDECKKQLLNPDFDPACPNGKPPKLKGCGGADGGLSLATPCCVGGEPPAVCDDLAVPDCSKKDAIRVCLDKKVFEDKKLDFDKTNVKLFMEEDPKSKVLTDVSEKLSGPQKVLEGIAILNNLILDTSGAAIHFGQDHSLTGLSCRLATRNTLVARNVIVGQRIDPTVAFVHGFGWAGEKEEPLPTPFAPLPKSSPTPLLVDRTIALIDIGATGTYEKSNGNRFFDNVIGQWDGVTLAIKNPQWSSGSLLAPSVPVGATELLESNAGNVFDKYTQPSSGLVNEGPSLELLKPGFPAVPDWVKLPADAKKVTQAMQIMPGNPFATDWSVRLPAPFRDNAIDYRWASIAALNKPGFGSGNTSAFGLKGVMWSIDIGGAPTMRKVWVPLFVNPGAEPPPGDWWPAKVDMPAAKLESSSCDDLATALSNQQFSHVSTFLATARDILGVFPPNTECKRRGPIYHGGLW